MEESEGERINRIMRRLAEGGRYFLTEDRTHGLLRTFIFTRSSNRSPDRQRVEEALEREALDNSRGLCEAVLRILHRAARNDEHWFDLDFVHSHLMLNQPLIPALRGGHQNRPDILQDILDEIGGKVRVEAFITGPLFELDLVHERKVARVREFHYAGRDPHQNEILLERREWGITQRGMWLLGQLEKQPDARLRRLIKDQTARPARGA